MNKDHTLESLFDSLSQRNAKPALLVLEKDTTRRWSYAELNDTVLKLARGLLARGIEKGDRVALLADNQPAWIVAALAVIRAGAIAVPLDVQFGDKPLTHVLDDSRPRLLLTTTSKLEHLQELDLDPRPDIILLDGTEDDSRNWRHCLQDGAADWPVPESEDTATLFYTSGTTGPPKGVPLSHRNLAFQLNTLIQANLVTENDRVLLPLPLHHVYPFVAGMLASLFLGLPLVLPYSLTGPQLVRALGAGEVTLIIGVPRLYSALYAGIRARAESRGRLAARLFNASLALSGRLQRHLGLRIGKWLLYPLHRQIGPRLRVLGSGGSALDPELAHNLEALGWQIAIGYGLTETSPLLTINPPGKARLDAVGKPIEGVEVRIDTEVRPGDEETASFPENQGEILARGPNVFSGYRHLPDKTAEVLTEDGWFRTGDLGYLDQDGYLHVTGRVSTLIVTEGGENIQPDQVEEAYEENPLIREIGVLQEDKRLVAVIVPALSELRRREIDAIDQAIRDAVAQSSRKLPSYQRIGDYVMVRDPLPRTRLGKIRRHQLVERYRQAKSGAEKPTDTRELSDEDRALLENPTVHEIWEWLSERYAGKQFNLDASPQLDLGVDSMEWLNLTLEIRNRTGVELPEEVIERVDTVRDLLQEIAAADTGEAVSPALPLEHPEEVLSDQQKRWLKPPGPIASGLTWLLYSLNGLLMRVLFRLRIEGLDRLPERAPLILTPNHLSLLDPFVVAAALGPHRLRRFYWGGWTGMAFSNPINRRISRLAQAVPIDPQRAAISSLAFGAAVIKRKKNLVWFPEGERSQSGELQSFKPGIGMILAHFQVPAVPVHIRGSFEALPRGHRLPRFRRITVVFGDPVEPAELERQGQGEKSQERIVQALHDRVARLGQR